MATSDKNQNTTPQVEPFLKATNPTQAQLEVGVPWLQSLTLFAMKWLLAAELKPFSK